MVKRLIILLICSIASTNLLTHPVHVSVVNISIDGLLMNVTLQTFVDDWETAYFHYFGKSIQLKEPENLEGEWFNSYFLESFRISSKNSKSRIHLIKDTIHFNDLSMKMEMHAQLKEEPDSLYIYNSILTDIFADQTNLLIYSVNGLEKGIRFDYYKHEDIVTLAR
ncbi:MAG: DUF6702 family protein [Bacteroidales bacterium]